MSRTNCQMSSSFCIMCLLMHSLQYSSVQGNQTKNSATQNNTSFTLKMHLEQGFNPLNAELNLICYLLALLAHHFLHVSRIRVKTLTFRLLMSYIYIYIYIYICVCVCVCVCVCGAPILDVSRSHTTTQHSR